MGLEGEGVEIRAFRGSRRSAVYREVVLSAGAFERVVAEGRAHELAQLASLQGARRLDRDQARALVAEIESLGGAHHSPELGPLLERLADVARWCARARGGSWLTSPAGARGRAAARG
jgi:hypothetical protein